MGTYRFTGLTPGAQYAVFVDEILDGGFSTPPRNLPGPEEFHSGAAESNSDAPGTFTAVMAAAGATRTGVNVIFNVPRPGEPLAVGDDGFVELFPPFPIDFCGRALHVAVRQCQRQHHFRPRRRCVLGIDARAFERTAADRGLVGRSECRAPAAPSLSTRPETASPCAGRACPNSPPWARTRSPSRSTKRICSARFWARSPAIPSRSPTAR